MKRIILFIMLSLNFNLIIYSQQNIKFEKNLEILINIRENASVAEIDNSMKFISEYKKSHEIQSLLLAIAQYPTGESYFLLGDNFFEKKQYKEAIEAYKISIDLGYEKNYYSFYNIACAYSLLESYDNSYDSLMKALSVGYKHFEWLYRDNDLSNLLNSMEYGDWISFSIEKYREKYFVAPFEIVHNVFENNLSFVEYGKLDNEWNIYTEIVEDNYIFSILTNRSSIDPVALALLCFKDNSLSFVITSEKINETSEKVEHRDIIFYITYKRNKKEIDNKVIKKAVLTFSHRV